MGSRKPYDCLTGDKDLHSAAHIAHTFPAWSPFDVLDLDDDDWAMAVEAYHAIHPRRS